MRARLINCAILVLLMGIVAIPAAAHDPNAILYRWDTTLQLGILLGGVMLTSVLVGQFAITDQPLRLLLSLAIAEGMVVAGFIHLAIGTLADWLLLANGVGYLVFIGVRLWLVGREPRLQLSLNGVVIIYTAITIAGYFYTHTHVDTVGLISKAAETLLIVALLVESGLLLRETSQTMQPTT